MEVTLKIFGKPQQQPRAKVRAFAAGGKVHAQVYDDKTHPVQAYKAAIRQEAGAMASKHSLPWPLDRRWPARLSVRCIFPRQQSHVWKTRPMPAYPHVHKPDVDNLLKSVMDALTGVAYVDDTQVVEARIIKWRSSGDEQPRTEITIWWDQEGHWSA